MSHRTPPGRRAPQSKHGRNTHKCDAYKSRNQRTKNKVRKQETIARRLHNAAMSRLRTQLA